MDATAVPTVKPAVFLDRDGTLIEDCGWLRDPTEVVFFPDTIEALRRLQTVAELFIVTNQSGISRGLLTTAEADAVNRFVTDTLAAEGIHIRAVYTCPHRREDGCDCIKPNPFFVLQAAETHAISPEYSFAVGDHPHDVEFAHHFGGKGIYVLTGHGQKHLDAVGERDGVARSIGPAVDQILGMMGTPPVNYLSTTEAAQRIRDGQVVAIPTETVYGMAGNALDPQAVQQIFDIKQRPTQDPLIVHLADPNGLESVADQIPPAAKTLAATFWPGPLTLVLPKKNCISDLVTAGLETVAVRVPVHPLAQAIIRQAGCPIAAPSANRFSTISPTRASHVYRQFGDSLAGIVDGGPCKVGVESTILGFWDDQIWLLRPGGLSQEQIEEQVGPIRHYQKRGVHDVRAPGSMPRHYAPNTPLTLLYPGEAIADTPKTGKLVFGPDAPESGDTIENLSPAGHLEEAAKRLYTALRRLDDAGLDRIVAYRLPDAGLGITINDRLQRAATAR